MLCALALWALLTPSVVAAAVIESERTVHCAMLRVAVAYVAGAVASTSAWLLIAVGGFDALAPYTRVCLALSWALAIVDVAVLCAVDCCEHRAKTGDANNKRLTLWFDERETEDEEAEHVELIAVS